MFKFFYARLLALLSLIFLSVSVVSASWNSLAELPDSHGLAGGFAGVSGDALLFAGGANFPAGAPWEGGSKVWHDDIYLLESPTSSEWRKVGHLPKPLGYGVAVSLPSGVLCIGGSNEAEHSAQVFLLQWNGSELAIEAWPSLPYPLAEMTGALLGDTVHVIGGIRQVGASTADAIHLTMDLNDPEKTWHSHPFPGPGRVLAVSAVQSNALFVVSGASLAADAEGKPQRTYLRDAWRYDDASGGKWSAVAEMPRPAVAAPSPAPASGVSHFLILGGDDGTRVGFEPIAEHPGFSREILAYDLVTNSWVSHATLPDRFPSQVTAPVVLWRKHYVIPSGETRPATRTPEVRTLDLSAPKADFGVINWIVVASYLLGMIGVGVWFMKREAASSTEAYFRGGQRIPWWVAGLSIFATMLSSITFMSIPARAYQTDISWYIGQLPIIPIVILVSFFYLPFFRKLDLTSAYEYLEKRFNYGCRIFASFSFIIFHIGRIAVVLYLPALALAAVSDIDVITAVVVIGALCLIYTVIGGIEAVVWTDAIQAIVLMGGAALCLVLAVNRVEGGLGEMFRIASEDSKLMQHVTWDNLDVSSATSSGFVIFVAFFFNSFVSYTGSQDVVQRYVTTRDIKAARRSLWTTATMSVFGSLIFFLLGTAIYAFFKSNPQQMDIALTRNDSILPFFIMSQLPIGISGLVIAAIFAASQSTVSSSLNSVATSWVKDVYDRILHPGSSDQASLRAAKRTVVVVGIFGIAAAVWMAMSDIASAFETFNTLIGLTAGSLGGLFALGIFSRSAHGRGALAGALFGFLLVLVIHLSKNLDVYGVLNAFVGCIASFVSGWVFSRILPRSLKEASREGAALSFRGQITDTERS